MGLDSPTLSYDGQSLPHSHISPASVIGAVVARPNIRLWPLIPPSSHARFS